MANIAGKAIPGAADYSKACDAPFTCPTLDCDGFVPVQDIAPQTRVYRTPVSGGVLHLTKYKFASLKHTNNTIIFAAAGSPQPHPHNRKTLSYPYGEFCTSDANLIAYLDHLAASGNSLPFAPVANPVPK